MSWPLALLDAADSLGTAASTVKVWAARDRILEGTAGQERQCHLGLKSSTSIAARPRSSDA